MAKAIGTPQDGLRPFTQGTPGGFASFFRPWETVGGFFLC
jgi:hypothetical protein